MVVFFLVSSVGETTGAPVIGLKTGATVSFFSSSIGGVTAETRKE